MKSTTMLGLTTALALVLMIEPSLCAVTTTPSMAPSASDDTTPVIAAGALSARALIGVT